MDTTYAHIRILKETWRHLKMVAAQTGESMLAVVHRLILEEYQRLGIRNGAH